MHVYDSVTNQTTYLGNTTETYFRISSLLLGHNYTFSVQARCLQSSQLCGEPALLLYNQLTAGAHAHTHAHTHLCKASFVKQPKCPHFLDIYITSVS